MLITGLTSGQSFTTARLIFENPPSPGKPFQVRLETLGASIGPKPFNADLKALLSLDDDPTAYGQALGQVLFAPNCLESDYKSTLAVINSRQEHLHIHLDIRPPELQDLHWERIYHPLDNGWFPMGSTIGTPLSRWVPSSQFALAEPIRQRPLQLLAVIASPVDLLKKYNLDPIPINERKALRHFLNSLKLKDVEITYLETTTSDRPTLENIRRFAPRGFHIIHFLCHGAVTPGGTVLYLEKPDGTTDPITTDRLIGAFKVLSPPPALCFLAACESANNERHDAFLPLGPALVQNGGVQAVIAMSDKVGIVTARTFASQFYDRLLFHGLVDQAVNEARHLVQGQWDWGVPVLFSRIEDNQILDFPISNFYDSTLARNDQVFLAVSQVRDAAHQKKIKFGLKALRDIDDLVSELAKSHKFLADTASDFRDIGYDPATFAGNFNVYYLKFKRMYDGETWKSEKTSCHSIGVISSLIMNELDASLDKQLKIQLQQALRSILYTDDDLVGYFKSFLDQMDNVVEDIQKKLQQNKLPEAIQTKLAFEAQISPSLRRSKDMLAKMSTDIGIAMKA
jgi:hypothetical protein